LKTIQDTTIRGERLRIDDKTFVNCILANCILEYSGGPVSFERTHLRGCSYVFYGRARRTVDFLQNTGLMPCVPSEWGEVTDLVH
jgi:hypothetical protein